MTFEMLVWREPWLAPVAMNIKNIIETEAVESIGITPDGKTLYYNTVFWKSLKKDEQLGVQIHEMLHIVNLHSKRRDCRTHLRWNIACDIAINHQIMAARYRLPQGALCGENDTAENIYNRVKIRELEIDVQGEKSSKAIYGGAGKNNDNSEIVFPTTNGVFPSMNGDLLKRNLDGSDCCDDIETLEAIESAGKLASQGNTSLAKNFYPFKSKADWRTVFHHLVRSVLGAEYDYLTYEFDEFGVCEDILSAKPFPKICVLIDESGSIEDTLYSQFLGELHKMEKYAEVYAAGFTDGTELNAVPLKKYHRTMTGGTDVRTAYSKACEENYDCVIVLTDGYLEFPKAETKQTIWVMPKSAGRKWEVIL